MKKILFSIIMVISILLAVETVFAESTKIEFSYKIDSDIAKVNGKEMKIEKPYINKGVTMVPIRLVANAFGSQIVKDEKTNSLAIKYNDIEIKFIIKSNIAYINGAIATLPAVSEIKAGTMMIPLKFVCENFGAEISIDNQTKMVTVTKEFAGENSIKDFGLILKKTTKNRIGDSYYKWSVNHPKDLKITYREFAGDYTKFSAVDKSYALYFWIYKNEDETLDSLMASELEVADKYTLISQGKEVKNGQEFGKTVYIDSSNKFVVEGRIYINNGYRYYVDLEVSSYSDYLKNPKYKALMDSFETSFIMNNTIEDLSDVDSNHLRTYESKGLKWSMKIPADYIKSDDEKKANNVYFYDLYNNMQTILVKMYSIENGLTLDSWVEHNVQYFNDTFNPALAQITKVEDSTSDGIKSKSIYSKIKLKDQDYYSYEKYIMGKNYRYYLSYVISEEEYNDTAKKSRYDAVIKSFKFKEPQFDEVGQLTDANMFPESTVKRTITDKQNKWSFQLPVSWTVSNTTGKDFIQYYNKDKNINFSIGIIKDANPQVFNSYYSNTLLKDASVTGKFENISRETINEKGVTIYKYVNKIKTSTADGTEIYYIIDRNGTLYVASFGYADIFYSAKNAEIIKAIWDSVKFE